MSAIFPRSRQRAGTTENSISISIAFTPEQTPIALSHRCLAQARSEGLSPISHVGNAEDILIRSLRLIKQPCEIEALRRAEAITREGILAMMRASRPGKYEYQYKADFDYALSQHGPDGPGFPSIISCRQGTISAFTITSYTGQAQDGDMVLNDVGAQ